MYCEGVVNGADSCESHRELIDTIQQQLDEFATQIDGSVVVINLASTESALDLSHKTLYQTTEAFEQALDDDHECISRPPCSTPTLASRRASPTATLRPA